MLKLHALYYFRNIKEILLPYGSLVLVCYIGNVSFLFLTIKSNKLLFEIII